MSKTSYTKDRRKTFKKSHNLLGSIVYKRSRKKSNFSFWMTYSHHNSALPAETGHNSVSWWSVVASGWNQCRKPSKGIHRWSWHRCEPQWGFAISWPWNEVYQWSSSYHKIVSGSSFLAHLQQLAWTSCTTSRRPELNNLLTKLDSCITQVVIRKIVKNKKICEMTMQQGLDPFKCYHLTSFSTIRIFFKYSTSDFYQTLQIY